MNKDAQQILDSLKCRAKTMEYTLILNELKQLEKILKTVNK
jgi:tRNA A37 threonylcarbamoyladenosine synthetase subunit TsaC/SUA5/YrdC